MNCFLQVVTDELANGAAICHHLATLSSTTSLPVVTRAKIKVLATKWVDINQQVKEHHKDLVVSLALAKSFRDKCQLWNSYVEAVQRALESPVATDEHILSSQQKESQASNFIRLTCTKKAFGSFLYFL